MHSAKQQKKYHEEKEREKQEKLKRYEIWKKQEPISQDWTGRVSEQIKKIKERDKIK